MTDPARGLRDRCVIVVGGGSGLGRAYSLAFGQAGAKVVVAGHSDTVRAVASEIVASGGTADFVIADAGAGSTIVEDALSRHGRVDALVCNAGSVCDRTFTKMDAESWRTVIDVHLGGAYACARAAWPVMIRQGAGRIVFTTSGAGFHGNYGQANYAAAKGALIALTKTLALEGAKYGIAVNAVAPMAATNMTQAVFDYGAPVGFRLALAHPEGTATGEVIEAGGGWAAAMRWQRSHGFRFDAATPSVEDVLARWSSITDFSAGADYPTTTVDSLAAAAGAHLAAGLGAPRRAAEVG